LSSGGPDDDVSPTPQQQSGDASKAEAFFSSDRPSWSRSVIFFVVLEDFYLKFFFQVFNFSFLFFFSGLIAVMENPPPKKQWVNRIGLD
jgi:hypothetical protein